MRGQRHEPEGFAEEMADLVALQRQRDRLDEAIDAKFVKIAVEMGASTSSIADYLNIKPPSVTERRHNALRRQQLRERSQLDSAA